MLRKTEELQEQLLELVEKLKDQNRTLYALGMRPMNTQLVDICQRDRLKKRKSPLEKLIKEAQDALEGQGRELEHQRESFERALREHVEGFGTVLNASSEELAAYAVGAKELPYRDRGWISQAAKAFDIEIKTFDEQARETLKAWASDPKNKTAAQKADVRRILEKYNQAVVEDEQVEAAFNQKMLVVFGRPPGPEDHGYWYLTREGGKLALMPAIAYSYWTSFHLAFEEMMLVDDLSEAEIETVTVLYSDGNYSLSDAFKAARALET